VLFAFSSLKDLVKGRELENGRIKEVRFMDVFAMDSDVILVVGSKVVFQVSFLLDQGEVLQWLSQLNPLEWGLLGQKGVWTWPPLGDKML
jgi:hypothetical protein